MNIEQIKTDLSAGVIVSPATWRKLVEAAMVMEAALTKIVAEDGTLEKCELDACAALDRVEEL